MESYKVSVGGSLIILVETAALCVTSDFNVLRYASAGCTCSAAAATGCLARSLYKLQQDCLVCVFSFVSNIQRGMNAWALGWDAGVRAQ